MATITTAVQLNNQMTQPLMGIVSSVNLVISSMEDMQAASGNMMNEGSLAAARSSLNQANAQIVRMNEDIIDAGNNTKKARNEQENYNEELARGSAQANGLVRQIAAMAGAYISFQAIFNTFKQGVEYASNLAEVQNVVDVTFGKMVDSANVFAKGALEAYGINEVTAKQYTGTMGAMLKSSGVTGNAIVDMSTKLTGLAGDMASFYNLSPEVVFEKIRSGISGETEPLKQLGINMSVANIEAYAMSKGITKAYNSMSQAEQVQLRYNYLLQSTSDAQGDFSRTSNSYANQTRLLKENWKQFIGMIAEQVLPVLARVVKLLNGIVTFMSNNWSVIQPILIGIITLTGVYVGVLAAHAIARGISTMMEFFAEVQAYKTAAAFLANINVKLIAISVEYALAVAVAQATISQAGFNVSLFACPLTWIIVLIVALIVVVVLLAKHFSGAGHTAQTTFGAICGGVNVVLQFFKNLGLGVANVALGIWSALKALGSNIKAAFGSVVGGVQKNFYELLSTALTVVEGICKALNKLPFVNFDYSGITEAANSYAAKSKAAAGYTKPQYESVSDAFKNGIATYDVYKDGWAKEAYKTGAAWGDKVSDKISGILNVDDVGKYEDIGLDSLPDSAAKTAANTAEISDKLDVTSENLKYIRDFAEQKAVNRYLSPRINIQMTNHNSVKSSQDLDSIVNSLNSKLKEQMNAVAEGVF